MYITYYIHIYVMGNMEYQAMYILPGQSGPALKKKKKNILK